MSEACGNFVQHKWRKEICANCQKARFRHNITSKAENEKPSSSAAATTATKPTSLSTTTSTTTKTTSTTTKSPTKPAVKSKVDSGLGGSHVKKVENVQKTDTKNDKKPVVAKAKKPSPVSVKDGTKPMKPKPALASKPSRDVTKSVVNKSSNSKLTKTNSKEAIKNSDEKDKQSKDDQNKSQAEEKSKKAEEKGKSQTESQCSSTTKPHITTTLVKPEQHYYHKYDITGKGKSGTPQPVSEKVKNDPETPQVLIQAYRVVDIASKPVAPPDIDPKKPPQLPNTVPEKDEKDSSKPKVSAPVLVPRRSKSPATSASSSPVLKCKRKENASSPSSSRKLLSGTQTTPSPGRSLKTESAPTSEEDRTKSLPRMPVILYDEAAQMQLDAKSPTPPRKVPILIPSNGGFGDAYEPIEGADIKNNIEHKTSDKTESARESGAPVVPVRTTSRQHSEDDKFQRQSPARASAGKSAQFEAKMNVVAKSLEFQINKPLKTEPLVEEIEKTIEKPLPEEPAKEALKVTTPPTKHKKINVKEEKDTSKAEKSKKGKGFFSKLFRRKGSSTGSKDSDSGIQVDCKDAELEGQSQDEASGTVTPEEGLAGSVEDLECDSMPHYSPVFKKADRTDSFKDSSLANELQEKLKNKLKKTSLKEQESLTPLSIQVPEETESREKNSGNSELSTSKPSHSPGKLHNIDMPKESCDNIEDKEPEAPAIPPKDIVDSSSSTSPKPLTKLVISRTSKPQISPPKPISPKPNISAKPVSPKIKSELESSLKLQASPPVSPASEPVLKERPKVARRVSTDGKGRKAGQPPVAPPPGPPPAPPNKLPAPLPQTPPPPPNNPPPYSPSPVSPIKPVSSPIKNQESKVSVDDKLKSSDTTQKTGALPTEDSTESEVPVCDAPNQTEDKEETSVISKEPDKENGCSNSVLAVDRPASAENLSVIVPSSTSPDASPKSLSPSTTENTSQGGSPTSPQKLERRKSRNDGKNVKTVRRMSAAPPPPPPAAKRLSAGDITLVTESSVKPESPPITVIATTLPLPVSKSSTARSKFKLGHSSSADEMLPIKKEKKKRQPRSKTLSEGMKMDIEVFNITFRRQQSSSNGSDLRGSKFLQRALPLPPQVKEEETSPENEEHPVENIYEMVSQVREQKRQTTPYEEVESADRIYHDIDKPKERRPPPQPPSLSSPTSSYYLEPISVSSSGGPSCSQNIDELDSFGRPKPGPRRKTGQALASSAVTDPYVMMYANREMIIDRPAVNMMEGFRKMTAVNLSSLQTLSDGILAAVLPVGLTCEDSPRWSDFQVDDTQPLYSHSGVAYYGASSSVHGMKTCILMISVFPVAWDVSEYSHVNVVSPTAVFHDKVASEYFPDMSGLPDPHEYQLCGLVDTTILLLNYCQVCNLEDHLAHCKTIYANDADQYERQVCYIFMQILNGLLYLTDKGCPVNSLHVKDILVVTPSDHDEQIVVLNPHGHQMAGQKSLIKDLKKQLSKLLCFFLNVDIPVDDKSLYKIVFPVRSPYSKGLQKCHKAIHSEDVNSFIIARNMLEFMLWGPDDEEIKSLSLAEDRGQAFSVWLELQRCKMVSQHALKQLENSIEMACRMNFLCAATGSTLFDTTKLLHM